MKEPEHLELNAEELSELEERILSSNLSTSDQHLVLKLLQFNLWLQQSLSSAKLSIGRLQRIIFGSKTEKRSKRSQSKQLGALNGSQDDPEPDKPLKRKGHGRRSHTAYQSASTIGLSHPSLQSGDSCPLECGGKVFDVDPGVVIRVKGNPLMTATRYVLETLRCNLCGERFHTPFPSEISNRDRYGPSVKAVLALQKYFMGSPFYRIEQFQDMLGVPLSKSTQWDLIKQLAEVVAPIYEQLILEAAQGRVVYNDDTKVKILSLMLENLRTHPKRKGMYTNGILSEVQAGVIALFLSGRQHAGENLEDVLNHRAKELGTVLQMSDALSASKPPNTETIFCYCLAHARRKFVDLTETISCYCLAHARRKFVDLVEYPELVDWVIDEVFGKVYHIDATAKKLRLNPKERLRLHKEKSKSILETCKQWLDSQEALKLIQPNSKWGEAIQYVQSHWEELTRFLEIEGVPLDNNITERALKVPIRNRKNAYFYKTTDSARVGDMMMSVIYTCWLAKKNPMDYLIQLQNHSDEVLQAPHQWLPWNYLQQKAA